MAEIRAIGFRVTNDEPVGDVSWASSEFTVVKNNNNRVTGFMVTSAHSLLYEDSKFYRPFSAELTPFVPIERVTWLSLSENSWIKLY